MAYFGKTYKLEKNEKFAEFAKALGLPAERAESFVNAVPTHKIEKNGDNYTIMSSISEGAKEVKFQNGVEYEESHSEGVTSKSVYTVSGDTVTQVQTFSNGRVITYKREYSADKLLVTITSSFWDGTARAYYVAV